VNPPEASFLVSGPLGSGNWETAQNPLNAKDLLFPGRGNRWTGSGKQENRPNSSAAQAPENARIAALKVTRLYEARLASDELIEALYELLAVADGTESPTSSTPCFSAQPE
jgi:hypothetical protein